MGHSENPRHHRDRPVSVTIHTQIRTDTRAVPIAFPICTDCGRTTERCDCVGPVQQMLRRDVAAFQRDYYR